MKYSRSDVWPVSHGLSEPLYIVGAGDLGTSAERVDASLGGILKVSATWGAVVLIDEADVFLEERSLQFLERNAMVAVFLRHLEYVLLCLDVPTVLKFQLFDRYFRGILFLTTNRVRVFDEAFPHLHGAPSCSHDTHPETHMHASHTRSRQHTCDARLAIVPAPSVSLPHSRLH